MIAILVTTKPNGVFFGYVEELPALGATSIRIERARMAVYWSADMGGVLGLAATGPSAGCRIGPAVPGISLVDVTAVVECASGAAEAWERAQWSP